MDSTNKINHICIFNQFHVSKAPRVVKEANLYASAGYKVTVYSLWYDTNLLAMDKTLLDPRITYKAGAKLLVKSSFKSIKLRFWRKLFRTFVKYLKIETVGSLGYGFIGYYRKLKKENADLYIGHQEMSMALAKKLIDKGNRVAFDFEDWHSKDLLPKDRKYLPIKLMERLEAYLLKNANYCYTTSKAMASAMAQYYASSQPKVIYNSFWASERIKMDGLFKDRKHKDTPSLYWFSQTIGPGRGLELLLDSLRFTSLPFQLHLRGRIDSDYKIEILKQVPDHIELVIHQLVPPVELISRIAEHDVGIAFEENHPESRNYTITNKMFHYFQAGIPVLATETEGQLEIARKVPKAMIIVIRDAKTIGSKLDYLFGNKEVLDVMKETSWQAGKSDFSFENQSESLINMLNFNEKE